MAYWLTVQRHVIIILVDGAVFDLMVMSNQKLDYSNAHNRSFSCILKARTLNVTHKIKLYYPR